MFGPAKPRRAEQRRDEQILNTGNRPAAITKKIKKGLLTTDGTVQCCVEKGKQGQAAD
jgi:hypothetical protein